MSDSTDNARALRAGKHLMDTAKKLGWPDDEEGAFEFITRRTREVAIEDTADPLADERVRKLVETGRRLEEARDAMRRVYAALTTTQAHKITIQKELDEAWAGFDAALSAIEAQP